MIRGQLRTSLKRIINVSTVHIAVARDADSLIFVIRVIVHGCSGKSIVVKRRLLLLSYQMLIARLLAVRASSIDDTSWQGTSYGGIFTHSGAHFVIDLI